MDPKDFRNDFRNNFSAMKQDPAMAGDDAMGGDTNIDDDDDEYLLNELV